MYFCIYSLTMVRMTECEKEVCLCIYRFIAEVLYKLIKFKVSNKSLLSFS